MTKETFENQLVEYQKRRNEQLDLFEPVNAVKQVVKSVFKKDWQSRSLEFFTYAILATKLDIIINKKGGWLCGTSERVWRERAERKMMFLFSENEKELEELIMSCTRDDELTERQKEIILLSWNKIDWPIWRYRGSNK